MPTGKGQRNFCANLIKKAKLKNFHNPTLKFLTDNKRLQRIVKPFCTKKVETSNNLILTEKNNKSLKEDGENATKGLTRPAAEKSII